jgi:hypothetical protein
MCYIFKRNRQTLDLLSLAYDKAIKSKNKHNIFKVNYLTLEITDLHLLNLG